MKEVHLRDFIAVVDYGGVRAAAREMGLTQAAVSRNLLALEADCRHPLLIRSNQGVELTDFGQILLRRARAATAELEKAKEELRAVSGGHCGGVAIGVSPAVEAALMPAAIGLFRKQYGKTLVRVTGGPAAITAQGLREGRLDFIIGGAGAGADKADGLLAEPLMTSDLAVVARTGHPLAGSTSLAGLAGSEWVVGVPFGAPQAELGSIFREHGLQPPPIAVQRDSSGVVHLLAQTDYLALITRHSAQLYCDAGLLAFVPVRETLPAVTMSLVTVRGRPLTATAEALAAAFRAVARSTVRTPPV